MTYSHDKSLKDRMAKMAEGAQEPRRETIAVAVTASEKEAIQMVGRVEETTVTELLRPVIEEIVARGDGYLDAIREIKPRHASKVDPAAA